MEQLLIVVAFIIISLIIVITLNRENRIWGICVSIAVGASLLLLSLSYLTQIVNAVKELCKVLDDDTRKWLEVITKASIVALVGEGVLSLCRDAGESSIAFKLELAIKIVICAMSLPIILELVKLLLEMLSQYQ